MVFYRMGGAWRYSFLNASIDPIVANEFPGLTISEWWDWVMSIDVPHVIVCPD